MTASTAPRQAAVPIPPPLIGDADRDLWGFAAGGVAAPEDACATSAGTVGAVPVAVGAVVAPPVAVGAVVAWPVVDVFGVVGVGVGGGGAFTTAIVIC